MRQAKVHAGVGERRVVNADQSPQIEKDIVHIAT